MMTSGYQLRVLSPPEIEPVTLAEAKSAAKFDPDIVESDDDFELWIQSARALAEAYTKRAFIERTLQLRLPDFPRGFSWPPGIELPQPPLIELLAVKYRDISGELIELTADQYQVHAYDEPVWIEPPPGQAWPVTNCQEGAVLIEYRAGYASAGSPVDASNVPPQAKQAIRMLVAAWEANRESIVAETRIVPVNIEYGFERCLDPLKVYP